MKAPQPRNSEADPRPAALWTAFGLICRWRMKLLKAVVFSERFWPVGSEHGALNYGKKRPARSVNAFAHL
jgi:hypothetical protein